MQLGSSKDSFPCFTRFNPCVAHCSTDSIPWVHHSREEGSLDYDGGFVNLQIHIKFDTNIYRQQAPFLAPLPGIKQSRSNLVSLFCECFISVFLLFILHLLTLIILKKKKQSNLVLINPNFSFFRFLFYF
jgi:hypothetical protein